MKLKYLLLMLLSACFFAFPVEAKAEAKRHYVGHSTLYGMTEGIYVKTRHPVLVMELQKDSKGYYWTKSDEIGMPKGLFSWLAFWKNKKQHKPMHKCYCLICKPTTFFDKQGKFISHMDSGKHFGQMSSSMWDPPSKKHRRMHRLG